MVEAVAILAAFAVSYLGIALLALTQRPHHGRVAGSAQRTAPHGSKRRCRWLAAASLAVGFITTLQAEGRSFGSLAWPLLLGCAALSVTFTLSFRPDWLRPLQRLVAPAQPDATRGARPEA